MARPLAILALTAPTTLTLAACAESSTTGPEFVSACLGLEWFQKDEPKETPGTEYTFTITATAPGRKVTSVTVDFSKEIEGTDNIEKTSKIEPSIGQTSDKRRFLVDYRYRPPDMLPGSTHTVKVISMEIEGPGGGVVPAGGGDCEKPLTLPE